MANTNVLSIFKEVSEITNRKIDGLLFEVQNKVLPNNRAFPGMDLSLGGEFVTYDEFEKLKALQPKVLAERKALELSFAGVSVFVMNKQIFYSLTKQLGLYRIYESPEGRSYVVNRGDVERLEQHENQIKWLGGELSKTKEQRSKIAIVTPNLLPVPETDFGANIGVGFFAFGLSLMVFYKMLEIPQVVSVIMAITFSIFAIRWLFKRDIQTINEAKNANQNATSAYEYNKAEYEKLSKQIDSYQKSLSELTTKSKLEFLFPDGVIKSGNKNERSGYAVVDIGVVQPSKTEHTRIVSAWRASPKFRENDVLCTVADPRAIDLKSIQYHFPPQPIDPGWVVEYEHHAVILIDTFYYVSDLEKKFLDESLKVAEKWEAKKHLLN